jgi:NAD+ kinase
MERLGVVVHPTRPVLDAVEVLEDWTNAHGVEFLQIPTGQQPEVAPAGEVKMCDLIVALGGDGTILKALHVSSRTRTPVLGIGYGSLGALTTVPADELRAALDRFAAGDWRARELPALRVRADDARTISAINDVVVARGRGTQLLLDVYVNGELYVRLAGDGAVVATAVGSSAYSMAAGGPLLMSGADAFVCTPLAMHGGSAPPLVVAGDREIMLDIHPTHSGFYVDIDGFPVATDARMLWITREHAYASLVDFDESGTGFPGLRARGLISDSPRLIGQDRLAARMNLAD